MESLLLPVRNFTWQDLNPLLDFIGRIGGDNLGMLLDTFHMNIEEPSIEESIRRAGDRIFHFHYSDSNRWYPGAGHLDGDGQQRCHLLWRQWRWPHRPGVHQHRLALRFVSKTPDGLDQRHTD